MANLNIKNNLIGESETFHELLGHLSKVAGLSRTVLVIGERGSGKELVAERIHYLSKRWDRPYIKLNCAALSDELLESELFGHEVGAFTGAVKQRRGRFELANGGTLFLDELANTSLRLQEKILRVVEYGEFERVGGDETRYTDVRIIAATNVDLPSRVLEGKFKADLLDRLAFDALTIPPLRRREGDIMLLSNYFAVRMVRELGGDLFPGFSENASRILEVYDWPGNVRELKNVIERAVYRSWPFKGEIDRIETDPFDSPYRPVEKKEERQIVKETKEVPGLKERFSFKREVNVFQKKLLEDALERNQYHQKKTAGLLGLTYNQFRGLMRKHGLV